jgi:hypothetical protein
MDYLLTSGTSFCVVKIRPADREILQRGDSRLLPKTIQFRCSKRPDPNCQYELSFSFWVAPLKIQSVTESDNHNYVVEALVLGPIEMSTRTHMKLVPGAVYRGGVHIALKWSSGEFSRNHSGGIQSALRLFSERLNRVPPAERELASARIEGHTRAPRGGHRRVRLATWKGTEPLAGFFQAARTAWRQITRPFDYD